MQLDDLKGIWQKQHEPSRSQQAVLDEAQLEKMLGERTAHTLAKVNKLFLNEIGVCLFLALSFSVVAVWKANDPIIILTFLAAMFCVLLAGLFMWRQYRQLANLGSTTTHLKDSLQETRYFLMSFMRQYTYIVSIGTTFSFVFGVMLGVSVATEKLLEEALLNLKLWYFLIPVSLITLAGFLFLIRYSMQRVYGKHLGVIEQNLQELE